MIKIFSRAQVDGLGEISTVLANLILKKWEALCFLLSSKVPNTDISKFLYGPIDMEELFNSAVLKDIASALAKVDDKNFLAQNFGCGIPFLPEGG